MPVSSKVKSARKPPPQCPLIFISHDSRDATIAEAFCKLLKNASGDAFELFCSSDPTGTIGIKSGTAWYSKIFSKLRSSSDVVCLLTEHSLKSPWVFYEAGYAKGNSKRNSKRDVHFIGIDIDLNKVNVGPCGQYQICKDDADSLKMLVKQLIDRTGRAGPEDEVILDQIQKFTNSVETILQKRREEDYLKTLRRLEQNWRRNTKEKLPEAFNLYSFCGITDVQQEDVKYPEIIYYLWADAGTGGSIKAQILKNNCKRIKVTFENKKGGYPSNVAIRLKGHNLVYHEDGFGYLKFKARISPDIRKTDLKEVQLGIRVIDALNTHWIYSYQDGYIPLILSNPEDEQWEDCKVDLLEKSKWKVFETDGNWLYHDEKPDFSALLAVIIEFGSKNAVRPGPGNSIVELKDFSAE